MTTIAHNQNVVKLTQINKGVSMQMLEPTEISVSLSPRMACFIAEYKERNHCESVSEVLELALQKLQEFEERKEKATKEKERWSKAYELAAKDEDVSRNLWETDEDVRGLY